MNIVTVGIDISKKTFDAQFKYESKWKHSQFRNSLKGFNEFKDWLNQFNLASVHIVLESTGRYGEDFSHFCYGSNFNISVVNPAAIKFFGMSKLSRAKTDKADSKLIAEFGMQNELELWAPKSPSSYKLQCLNRCINKLIDTRTQLLNCIEGSSDRDVINAYQKIASSINNQIEDFENQILELIQNEEDLNEDFQNLLTVPGIAEKTAITLLAEIPDISQFKNSKQLVAYAGLNPSVKQSGTSVRGNGGISKKGSRHLRKSLYYPSISAKRFNKKLQPMVLNLQNRGKKPKQIIVACMRKLLVIVYWILKKKEAYAY